MNQIHRDYTDTLIIITLITSATILSIHHINLGVMITSLLAGLFMIGYVRQNKEEKAE